MYSEMMAFNTWNKCWQTSSIHADKIQALKCFKYKGLGSHFSNNSFHGIPRSGLSQEQRKNSVCRRLLDWICWKSHAVFNFNTQMTVFKYNSSLFRGLYFWIEITSHHWMKSLKWLFIRPVERMVRCEWNTKNLVIISGWNQLDCNLADEKHLHFETSVTASFLRDWDAANSGDY